MELAAWIVLVLEAYFALGLVFALAFAFRWVGRLDPVARSGTLGFRLLIVPGAAALWPVLVHRLVFPRSGAADRTVSAIEEDEA